MIEKQTLQVQPLKKSATSSSSDKKKRKQDDDTDVSSTTSPTKFIQRNQKIQLAADKKMKVSLKKAEDAQRVVASTISQRDTASVNQIPKNKTTKRVAKKH
ncbi:unnamed protein product [Didymodactylos carnosus]|uniref:Uncharacterized protein n=1 Tax=Didymodactylos carnosus TaxID=1234261 RepID=A0A814KC44_9BILA|nr:unnamed protein product [Didymodactylos carnosus]CAF1347679.1 unnamed protein product [Didymodactylos carnosus]CAF3817195.1 unnamed protein product [Didymodactylos carnosus]CAF4158564.1 unnamed protein product [Didymodactylos carnosus]